MASSRFVVTSLSKVKIEGNPLSYVVGLVGRNRSRKIISILISLEDREWREVPVKNIVEVGATATDEERAIVEQVLARWKAKEDQHLQQKLIQQNQMIVLSPQELHDLRSREREDNRDNQQHRNDREEKEQEEDHRMRVKRKPIKAIEKEKPVTKKPKKKDKEGEIVVPTPQPEHHPQVQQPINPMITLPFGTPTFTPDQQGPQRYLDYGVTYGATLGFLSYLQFINQVVAHQRN
jgi:hypothetical protein